MTLCGNQVLFNPCLFECYPSEKCTVSRDVTRYSQGSTRVYCRCVTRLELMEELVPRSWNCKWCSAALCVTWFFPCSLILCLCNSGLFLPLTKDTWQLKISEVVMTYLRNFKGKHTVMIKFWSLLEASACPSWNTAQIRKLPGSRGHGHLTCSRARSGPQDSGSPSTVVAR